jgi:hypothetical protein
MGRLRPSFQLPSEVGFGPTGTWHAGRAGVHSSIPSERVKASSRSTPR